MRVAAILLAAGAGTRFTASGGVGHKLLAPYLGRTVIEWSIESATAANLPATYVVRGSARLPLPSLANGQVEFVRNPRWQDGLATSLQTGITAARRDGFAAVVVGLGDQPLVLAETWQRLAAAPTNPITVASYRGHCGYPMRLTSMVWPLLPTTGDKGPEVVIRRRPDLVSAIPCRGDTADINTLNDLTTWS